MCALSLFLVTSILTGYYCRFYAIRIRQCEKTVASMLWHVLNVLGIFGSGTKILVPSCSDCKLLSHPERNTTDLPTHKGLLSLGGIGEYATSAYLKDVKLI